MLSSQWLVLQLSLPHSPQSNSESFCTGCLALVPLICSIYSWRIWVLIHEFYHYYLICFVVIISHTNQEKQLIVSCSCFAYTRTCISLLSSLTTNWGSNWCMCSVRECVNWRLNEKQSINQQMGSNTAVCNLQILFVYHYPQRSNTQPCGSFSNISFVHIDGWPVTKSKRSYWITETMGQVIPYL